MSELQRVDDRESKKWPYWVKGLLICSVIYTIEIIHFASKHESQLLRGDTLYYDLSGLFTFFILFLILPIILVICIIASFFQRKIIQFKLRWIVSTMSIIFFVAIFKIFLMPYFFPITYYKDFSVCAKLNSLHCYQSILVREQKPMLCDKIDFSRFHRDLTESSSPSEKAVLITDLNYCHEWVTTRIILDEKKTVIERFLEVYGGVGYLW